MSNTVKDLIAGSGIRFDGRLCADGFAMACWSHFVTRLFVRNCFRSTPASNPRQRGIVALMAYGGLRRSEVVGLDVGDYAQEVGLRGVRGKGGHEAALPFPKVARSIVSDYLTQERAGARGGNPMFVVRYRTRGGVWCERRMTSQRMWKIIKALGRRAGLPELHPHAFRHGCGVELHRRTGSNLRVVQEHLRHADIQTTTVYTRLTQYELQQAVSVFDKNGSETAILIPTRRDQNSRGKTA